MKTNATTVSRHIKRLTEQSGKTLALRQSNGEWMLTSDGEVFASAAKRCFSELEALEVEDAKSTSRIIKVSTTEFLARLFFTPKIEDLAKESPDISLSIDCRDENVSLAYGEADLAIRLSRPTAGRLVGSKIADVEMNIFSVGGKQTKAWVGLTEAYDWVPEMQLGLSHFGCSPAIRTNSLSIIRRVAVDQGMACVGPTMMMSGFEKLAPIENSLEGVFREIWSVYHESRKNDDALVRVREWAKRCLLAKHNSTAGQSLSMSNACISCDAYTI